MMPQLQYDPLTREWIIGNRRIPLIAGGSSMVDDEVGRSRTSGDPMDIEVDDPNASDEDDDDKRLQSDDDDDDENEPADEEKYVPKADLERAKAALKNERRDRKRLQREFEDKIKALQSETTESSVIEVEKARIDERTKRDQYWAKEIVQAKAEAEFAAQGATSEMAQRLAGLVNLNKVEWDERDREWDGLEDEVDAIIQSNPEFFKAKTTEEPPRRGAPRPRVDAGTRGREGGGAPRKKPRTADIIANQALGRNRRR